MNPCENKALRIQVSEFSRLMKTFLERRRNTGFQPAIHLDSTRAGRMAALQKRCVPSMISLLELREAGSRAR